MKEEMLKECKTCSFWAVSYLGLVPDEHLTYNKHIKEINKLVSHKLYILSKVRKYITQAASIDIFKTMILSLIEYCDILMLELVRRTFQKVIICTIEVLDYVWIITMGHLGKHCVKTVRVPHEKTGEMLTCCYLCTSKQVKICIEGKSM